jgi:hypothetical protein
MIKHAAFAVVAGFSFSAAAHFELDAPTKRHDGDNHNKAEPCGSDVNARAEAARVSSFVAGTTVTLRWRETIGHSGSWRISLDVEGSDSADFQNPENVLLTLDDPSGSDGNVGNGNEWEATVSMPGTPCANCTIQIQQIMTTSSDPAPGQIYSECADIVLLAPEVVGEGESEGEGEAPPLGEGEGEGEVDAPPFGEGEGEQPPSGEGEGDAAEGEGEGVTSEGEGEGETEGDCAQTGVASMSFMALSALLWASRRRR